MGDISRDTPSCFFQKFRPRYLDLSVPADMKNKPPYIGCMDCKNDEGNWNCQFYTGHSIQPAKIGMVIAMSQESIPEEYRDKKISLTA